MSDYTTGEFSVLHFLGSMCLKMHHRYTASLKAHKELYSLESHHAPSENELRLVYALTGPNGARKRVSITLLFVPNTRRLAEAQVEGISSSLEEVIGVHTQANDVSGLISALLATARGEF